MYHSTAEQYIEGVSLQTNTKPKIFHLQQEVHLKHLHALNMHPNNSHYRYFKKLTADTHHTPTSYST
jgi:hypothetical protein